MLWQLVQRSRKIGLEFSSSVFDMGRIGVSVFEITALWVSSFIISALLVPSKLENFMVVIITIPISTNDSMVSATTQDRLNTMDFITVIRLIMRINSYKHKQLKNQSVKNIN
jgi:hypothetical protein